MHGFEAATPPDDATPSNTPWWKELTRYHWFVLIVAALGWLFDTMDQQLFNLARAPAMKSLLEPSGLQVTPGNIDFHGGIATSVFLVGWATGGLLFGIMGDRVGRAKTMLITILLYSAFTGLSALSWNTISFAAFRFLTGLGVGGEFAVGVALVAEVMPRRARPFALGLLQALSAVGNIAAAVISMILFGLDDDDRNAWRWMFVVGAVPALLALLIRRRLKEPEKWQSASDEQLRKQLGSYKELFGNPLWRKHAWIGMFMAASGVIGLWGIGFFSVDLGRSVFRKTFEVTLRAKGEAEKDRDFVRAIVQHPALLEQAKDLPKPGDLLGLVPKNKDAEMIFAEVLKQKKDSGEITPEGVVNSIQESAQKKSVEDKNRMLEYVSGSSVDLTDNELKAHSTRITDRNRKLGRELGFWAAMMSIMQNVGAFFGIYAFTYITHYLGRRPTFAISYVLALLSTIMVFGYLTEFSQIFWMIPIMGFCQLALFGGYAIYFPELFPTHLRSTGTSFCYNVGRFVAACGPLTLGSLSKYVFASYNEPMRPAAVWMSVIFVMGLLALPFAPETKGRPLPE